MPATHTIVVSHQIPLHTILKHDRDEPVIILQEAESEAGPRVYVHYVNLDKRNDEWVNKSLLNPISMAPSASSSNSKKRKRQSSPQRQEASVHSEDGLEVEEWQEEPNNANGQTVVEQVTMTEEEYDLQHHKQLNTRRNFDNVYIGDWLIKTWYFSPYPLTENEDVESVSTPQGSNVAINRVPGVTRATNRAHGRTSDMLAAGMGRRVEKEILYVCDMCFKYMTDASTWEAHKKLCTVKHPPGRKVYQRGAHTIWEVDGTKEKLYCQNLSLFGKLFIDIKTLFFDCDNFLFYILTDASTNCDHMLGFFSKEKISYDDYNLACIITLPPFQRQGWGRLMIEFSYELSRRAGKVGTPERPLSDLGLRSYLAYWVSTLVRFFRKLLEVMPVSNGSTPTDPIITRGVPPDFRSPSRELSASEDGSSVPRRRKRVKGWDGEVSQEEDLVEDVDEKLGSLRTFVTVRNPDGSATVHIKVQCSLADIAQATNLRVEDAAFALNEMGMLEKWGRWGKSERIERNSKGDGNGSGNGKGSRSGSREEEDHNVKEEGQEEEEEPVIILTREMVEKVAKERGVKAGASVLNLNHVKL
ncbi:hypothetical protein GYMLUDRAFT_38482 [Collybiopsis luxurians FD-317 M1]|nr:hypothetical protein GYMLUDRAFT_38482 [Collybiopsis luxurians FD-317 M1]